MENNKRKLVAKSLSVTNKKNKTLELPGIVSLKSFDYNPQFKIAEVGQVDDSVTKKIRQYLDILLNSAILEAHFVTAIDSNQRNSLYVIPGIVNAILTYNNIIFKTIKFKKTKVELFEPIWFTYDLTKNELILYFNESMYDEFCTTNNLFPVTFSSGVISLETFNPYKVNEAFKNIELTLPIINCAIASDHVAQHIITELFVSHKSPCADIHENFTKIGTTLHTIFTLEKLGSKVEKREYNTSFIPNLLTTENFLQTTQINNLGSDFTFSYNTL